MSNYWFISTKYRRSSKLALFACLLAFTVILLGAYTRLTDAGLSCPDWPNCYGFVTAPHTTTQLQDAAQNFPAMPVNIKKAWTEMTHRYFAGTEGILILVLAFSILFASRARDLKSALVGFSLITLLCIQVMLGMLTVTEKLRPLIVLSHLLTGLSILCVLWWTYLDLHVRDDYFPKRSSPRLIAWFWTALFVVAGQITLGGWVSTHYAGLACIDLPYCNGKLLPTLNWQQFDTDLITIHMAHRIGALITALFIGFMSLWLMFTNASFRAIAILMFVLVIFQMTLGIFNILWLRPVWLAMIHQSVAILLLLTVMTALVKSYYESRENRYGSWIA